MALSKATLRVPMTGVSLNTKADPKSVPTSQLLGAENAIYTKLGSLNKRHGYDALPTAVLGSTTPYDDARGLAARDSELVLFTGERCYSYVEGASQWSDAGPCYSVAQSSRVLTRTPSAQTAGDYATVSGIGLAAWEDSRGGVYYAVLEDDRGRVTLGPLQASGTGTRPRCVRCGDKLALLWAEAALGQIKLIIIDPTAPNEVASALFPVVLVADLVTTQPGFDAAYFPSELGPSGAAYLAWNAVDGVHFGILDPSGVLGSPVTSWPSPIVETPPAAVTVGPSLSQHFDGEGFDDGVVAYCYATATEAFMSSRYYEGSELLERASSVPAGGVSSVDNLTCAIYQGSTLNVDVYAEVSASPARTSVVWCANLTVAGAVGNLVTFRGCALAAKAFASGEYSFVTVVHDVPLFGVYLTLRSDGVCVARTLPGLAGDTPVRPHLPQVFSDDGEVHRWTAVYKNALSALNDDQFSAEGLTVVSLDFDSDGSHQTAQAGTTLYLGGASPLAYDGVSWVEQQPHYGLDWEDGETLHANSNSGTGAITAGTRAYVFWVEWDLANGEVMRGPVSKPYEVVLVGPDDTTTLTVPTLRITEMASTMGGRTLNRADARICVARTVDGDASIYYRVSGNPGTTGDNGAVTNDTTADSVSFVDVMSDEDLLEQEPIYTTGGVLSNDPVAATEVIAGGKGRLFVTDPADGNLVRFSKERENGSAIEWAPELMLQVDQHGGAITGIAVMDDAVILFKRSAIYAVSGPGPLANPEAGGGWSSPQLVTSDVGCLSQRSIGTTPAGLVFQSAKGIYLIDRSMQVSYVGAAVESYNSQTVTRATLVDDTTQVRFLTDSGSTLCFDYRAGQWSTFTNHEGYDAVVVDGVYHYLRTDGRVFVEDSTGYDDAGLRIPMRIETAWIHFQEHLQGFQKLWHLHVLGTWKSAHTLRVYYRFDYGTQWLGPVEFDASDMGGTDYGEGDYGDGVYSGTEPSLYQWRFHVGQKSQAAQFAFVDFESDSYGAAYELTELVIDGGVKGPVTKRLPAERSA